MMFFLTIRVNQAMFSGLSNVDSYASGKNILEVKMPSVSAIEEESDDQEPTTPKLHLTQIKNSSEIKINFQIPDLVTLSLLPKSQWQNLTKLDIIKVWYYLFMIILEFMFFTDRSSSWI